MLRRSCQGPLLTAAVWSPIILSPGMRQYRAAIAISIRSASDGRTCLRSAKQLSARRSFPEELWCCRHSIPGPGKGHELYEDNGTHPRLTRVDLFDNGELLWRIGRP